jgi:hypothetical protein
VRRADAVRWMVLAAFAGAVAGAAVDPGGLPLVGSERLEAVVLLDGQAYFGHLEDSATSDTLVLRDVYYLQDARNTTTNLPLALVRRGAEVHGPRDGMRIRREKVLAIERVDLGSAVATAIAEERALRGRSVP